MAIFRNKLFKSASTYGFFSLINSAIPFLLMPVMTRYLSAEDYGIIAVSGMMVSIITPLISLNVHFGYSRAYFSPERFDRDVYLGTALVFLFFSGFLTQVIFYFFADHLSAIFVFPTSWICIVPFITITSLIGQTLLTSWQVSEQPRLYGFFQNGRSLSEMVGAIIFVVLLGMSWQGRILSRAIVFLLFAVIAVFILIKKKLALFKFDWACLRHAIIFGVPLIPHSLAGILDTTIGRVFISHMVSISETGLYTVGFQVGSIIGLFAAAFNQAYAPWLFRKLQNVTDGEKIKIVRFTYVYFFVIIVSTLVFVAISPFFMRVFVGKEFHGSLAFLVWIALGYCFDGMYYMVVNYIFYVEKTYLLGIVTFFGAAVNVFLSYFFILHFGTVGAAQATSLTHLFTFLCVWYLSSSVYPMPWKSALRFKKN